MSNIKGFSDAVISSTTFGRLPGLAVPVINSGMDMNSVLSYRFVLSALLMLAITLLKKSDLKVSLKELGALSFLGLLYGATAKSSRVLTRPRSLYDTIMFDFMFEIQF